MQFDIRSPYAERPWYIVWKHSGSNRKTSKVKGVIKDPVCRHVQKDLFVTGESIGQRYVSTPFSERENMVLLRIPPFSDWIPGNTGITVGTCCSFIWWMKFSENLFHLVEEV